MSDFIILVEETNNCRLTISLKWFVSFIPLKDTAFALHPARPIGDEYEFEEYEMAKCQKMKWEHFLNSYLIKK